MKRIIAFALTLAMLVSMVPLVVLAQDTDNGVALKPFTATSWSKPEVDVDYVYLMPYTWSNGTPVPVDPEDPDGPKTMTISFGTHGGSKIENIAQALKEDFNARPEGTRVINFSAMTDAFKDNVVATVDFTLGVEMVSNWLREFLAYYKSIGGELDGLMLDLEYNRAYVNYLHNTYTGADTTANEQVYNQLAASSFYQTKIRPILVERGFNFYTPKADGKPWQQSELGCLFKYTNAGEKEADYVTSRSIWGKVVDELLVAFMNEAVYAPLMEYYPDAKVSDYHTVDYQAWLKGASATGGATGGKSSAAGNASAYSANYASSPDLKGYFYYESLGDAKRTAYNQPVGFNDAKWEAIPFNMAMWDVNRFKTMREASVSGNIDAWFAGYNYSKKAQSTSNTPYYAEIMYHLGLLDARFYGYTIKSEMGAGFNTGMIILDELMTELTRVAGTEDRKPLKNLSNWNGSYMLTGMYAGGRDVYRLTPDTTKVSKEDFKVAGKVPTFYVDGLTITFPQGRIIEDAAITEIGTCGYWIEVPAGVKPVITAEDGRYTNNPAFVEDFADFDALLANETLWTVAGAAAQSGALALTGDATATNQKTPKNVTAGDAYATKQGWEIDVTVPEGNYGEILLLSTGANDGIKISGGKAYYFDANGTAKEICAVTAGTYTVKRYMDFSAMTCVYTVGETTTAAVAMKAVTTPVANITMSTTGAAATVLVDNYKLYQMGMNTTFEIYNADTAAKITNVAAAGTGNYVYRVSYLNATNKLQTITVKNGDQVVETIAVAPGTDGWTYGSVDKTAAASLTYTIAESEYVAPEIDTDTNWEGMYDQLGIACFVGQTGYATLAEAIAAAKAGDTIVMMKDVALSTPVALTKNIKIRGNGYAIAPAANFSGSSVIDVCVGGELTILEGTVINAGAKTGIVVSGGTLNVAGGKISGKDGIIVKGGNLNMTAGTVAATTGAAIVVVQDAAKTAINVKATGGKLVGDTAFRHYNANATASENVTVVFSDVAYTGTVKTEEEHCAIFFAQKGFHLHQHTVEYIPAVDGDCETPGSTSGVKYTCCGTVVTEPKPVGCKHTLVAPEGAKCGDRKVCSTCGKLGDEIVDHTFEVVDGAHVCSKCDLTFTGTYAQMWYLSEGVTSRVGSDEKTLTEGKTQWFAAKKSDPNNPNNSYVVPVTNGSLNDDSASYIKFYWPVGGTPTLVLKNVELKSVIGIILGGHYNTSETTMTSSAKNHDIPYNVQIIGDNTITELYSGNYGRYSPLAFCSTGVANIYGSGTLNIVSNENYTGTITNYGDINLIGANISMNLPDSIGYGDAIHAMGGDLTIDGGSFTLVALDNTASNNETVKTVFNAKNITIEDGAVIDIDIDPIASSGASVYVFAATGDIKISDSDIDVKSGRGHPFATKTPILSGVTVVTSNTLCAQNSAKDELVAPTSGLTTYTAEEFNALESVSAIRYFKTTHACVKGTEFTLEAPEYACSTTQNKVYTCTICGGEVRESVAVENAAAHVAGETKETAKVEATAEAKGSYTLTTYCADCGEAMATKTVETTFNTAERIVFTYAINYSNLGKKEVERGYTVYVKQTDDGKPATGSASDWNIKLEYPVDRPATLTLKDVNLSGEVGLIFGNYFAKDPVDAAKGETVTCDVPLNIVLEGEKNYIYASHANLGALDLYTTGDVTISGDAPLYLKSNRSSANAGAINAYGNLTLDNVDVTIELVDSVNNSSLVIATHSGDLTVDGGKLYIDAYDDPNVSNNYEAARGLFAGNNVTIKNGADVKAGVTLCADNNIGVNVTGDFTIDNSDVEIGFYRVKSTAKTFIKAPVLKFAADFEFAASTGNRQAFFNTADYTFNPYSPIDYETYLTKDVTTVYYLKTVHTCVKSAEYELVAPEYACSTLQGKLYHCVYCGAEMAELVSVDGATAAHTDSGIVKEIEAVTATAGAKGYYKLAKVCAVCGEYYDVETIETTLNPDTIKFTSAASYGALSSAGTTINRGETKYYKINDSKVMVGGSASEWNIKFEYPADRPAVLTLNGVDMSGNIGLIYGNHFTKEATDASGTVTCNVPLNIVLIGQNSINANHSAMGALDLYTTGDITISGEGSLYLKNNRSTANGGALNAYGNLTLDNVDVTIELDDTTNNCSNVIDTHTKDLVVNGGKLYIDAFDDPSVTNNWEAARSLFRANNVTIKNGADVKAGLTMCDTNNIGVKVTGDFTIINADVEIGTGSLRYTAADTKQMVFAKAPVLQFAGDYEFAASSAYVSKIFNTADFTFAPTNLLAYDEYAAADVTTMRYFKVVHTCVKGELIEAGSAEYACSTKKVDKYACAYCGKVIEESTPVDGATIQHTPGETKEVERVNATSTANGYYVMKTFCTVCGEEIEELTKTVTLYARTEAVLHWIAYGTNGPVGSYKQSLTAGQGAVYFKIGTDADYPNNLYPQKITDGTIPEDNYIKFDYTGDVATLTLKNVTIKNCLGLTLGATYQTKTGMPTHTTNYKVVIEGENTIQTMNLTNWNALDFTTLGDVTITGADEKSSLTLISDTGYNGVLGTFGNLNIVDANLTIKLPETASKAHGINTNGGDITIENSNVYIVGGDDPNTDANGGSANGNAMLSAIHGGDLTVKDSDLKVHGSPYHYCLIETESATFIDSTVELAITDRTYDYGMFKTAPVFKYENENFIADASTKLSGFVADGYVVTVPTTTVIYNKADLANYKYLKVVPHVHTLDENDEGVVTAPTCKEQGYTTYTCTECGRGVDKDFTPVAHNWVEADCLNPKTCPTCGLTEGEAKGHSFVATAVAPTCNMPGGTQYTCADCDVSYIISDIAAKGHTKKTVAGYPATCVTTGLTDGVVCTACGETLVEQEVIPAGAHNYTAVVTAPTCTAAGYTTYTCTGCGETYTEAGEAATGHGEYTYTNNGDNHTVACGKCDYTATEEHIFVDGADCICGAPAHTCAPTLVEAKDPTYSVAGNTAYYICDCGKYFSDAEGQNEIAAESVVIAPTAVGTNSKMKFYRSSAEASAGNLMLGSDIKGSFTVDTKNLGYSEVFLEITMAGVTTRVYPADYSSSRYKYFEYTVFSYDMTELITLTVCGKTGENVYTGETATWTVKESALVMLKTWYSNYNIDEKQTLGCKLIVSMLHYGAESQKNFGKNVDNLATDGAEFDPYRDILKELNENEPEMGAYPAVNESGMSATIYSTGLMLQEKVKMYGMFRVPNKSVIDGFVVKIVQNPGTVDEITHTITEDEMSLSGRYLTFYFEELASYQLRDTLEITLYKDGKAVSATYTRDLGMIGNSMIGTYPTLVPAILNYADCAKAYFV